MLAPPKRLGPSPTGNPGSAPAAKCTFATPPKKIFATSEIICCPEKFRMAKKNLGCPPKWIFAAQQDILATP